MEDVKKAQEELDSTTATVVPQSLDDIVAGLSGFGIEDFEEILTLEADGRKIRIRLGNICTDDEMVTLMAVEGQKGYAWTQRVKCEILSRAISWLALGDNPGVSIRNLPADKRLVKDTDGQQKDIQIVLRNAITGWGQELVNVLWKVFMVHSQKIEDRLTQAFPQNAVMTDVERRFLAQANEEIKEATREQIRSTIAELFDKEEEAPEAVKTPEPKA